MNHEPISISRPLVGWITAACLTTAVVIFLQGSSTSNAQLWQAAFTRVGLVMGALWLALPSRNRASAFANVSMRTFLGIILAIFAFARYPRTVLPLLVLIGALGILLRPRDKKRPSRARK